MGASQLHRPRLPDATERADAAARGMWTSMWAAYQGDVRALISPTGSRSFAELNENINRLARIFRGAGLEPDDAVAIVCSNRPAFVEAVYASLRVGLRYTPVNWHLRAEEIAYIVNDCGAKAVVGDVRFAAELEGVPARCPDTTLWLAVGGGIDGYEHYEDALGTQDGSDIEDPVLGSRMLYTSGTTGRPKGVVRPPNYSTGLRAITTAPGYEAGSGQMNLCTGPYYHGGPLSFSLSAPLNAGVGVVIMERWDAVEALRLIETHRVTHTHMVPIMFHRLLRVPADERERFDVSSLRYVLHGAAKCPVRTKRAMLEWFGSVLWEYFAATEGAGASVGPDEWLAKPGTVGLPPSPDHVRILGEDGTPLAAGSVGHIYIKRSGADFTYWNDPDKTAEARRGGYFTVGDIGYLDEDGYLFVTDRDANMIVSGGVNIYPAEIEAALLMHPAVRDAGVIGVPNEEWGEEVKAVVQRASDVTDAALIAHCREHLAGYKCPRTVDFADTLPRQDNGKLYRNELRARYRA